MMMEKIAIVIGVLTSLYLVFTRGVWDFLSMRAMYEKPRSNFSRLDRLGQILFALLILGLLVLGLMEMDRSAS